MSQQELVRARIGDREVNVGRTYAESNHLEILNEPTHLDDGTPRPETRAGGRPVKPQTTVALATGSKKAAAVIDSAPIEKG